MYTILLGLTGVLSVASGADFTITEECEDRSSEIRQSFHIDTEKILNRCYKLLLTHSYEYGSIQNFFDQADVALPGLEFEFSHASSTESKDAATLQAYITQRGGCVSYPAIQGPSTTNWQDPLFALERALSNAKEVLQCYNDVYTKAKETNDGGTTGYIERLLNDRIEIVKKMGGHVTNAKRNGPDGIGVFLLDKFEKWNFGPAPHG
ncbi:unnamed protein product [Owenia fusiformis]|uniref:Ferritin n=1 Tax=Owenia fusiformis TaxID=6347 RepID=A0A8J1UKQ9_OWEFU|nr:unnamed protein product [Owenia fusiformis]